MRIVGMEINWFHKILQKGFNVTLKVNETATEATELGLDEVEDSLYQQKFFLGYLKVYCMS